MHTHSIQTYLTFFITILILIFGAHSERIYNKIYIPLSQQAACFRKLNATGQYGCSSTNGGNIGIVFVALNSLDLQKFLQSKGTAEKHIVFLHSRIFTQQNLNALRSSDKVNGILLSYYDLDDLSTFPPSFSPDDKCPDDRYGMYSNNSNIANCKSIQWNWFGNSLLFQDIGFPIHVLMNKTEVEEILIKKCYNGYNQKGPDGKLSYPLCAAELFSAMFATIDTITCLRRSRHEVSLNVRVFCSQLMDYNVITTIQSRGYNEKRKENSVIVVGAKIDSASLFDGIAPGANSDLTGVVALLAAAKVLKDSGTLDVIKNSTMDLLIAFFHGEVYDYIGSSRMVYDMESGSFPYPVDVSDGESGVPPINLSHISRFIEVNQLGYNQDGLWIHTDPLSEQNPAIKTEIDDMITTLSDRMTDAGVKVKRTSSRNQPLPPASVQSFLKKRVIPAIVLTDHDKVFKNKYYNSRLDLPSLIDISYPGNMSDTDMYEYITPQASRLTRISTLLARYIKKTVLPQEPVTDLLVDESDVTHLLYCFTINANCSLFQKVLDSSLAEVLPDHRTLSTYISVNGQDRLYLTTMISSVLNYFTGNVERLSKKECTKTRKDKTLSYVWMQGNETERESERGGVCMSSPVFLTKAVSPAFDIEGYDMLSGEYSTWAESSWAETTVKLFLIPSESFKVVTLVIGIIILIASHVVVYFVNKNIAKILDFPVQPEEPCLAT